MAEQLTITDGFDVPLPVGGLNFGVCERLVDSTITMTVKIWNDLALAGGCTTAKGLLLFPQIRPTALDPFLASGYEFCDAQAMQWRLTGNVDDPSSGTSGGRPEDYAPVTTTFKPCGGRAFALIPNIPAQFARELELKVRLNATGGPLPIDTLKLALLVDPAIYGLDAYSEEREGNASILRWERSRNAIACGVGYRAAEISESPATANAPLIQHCTWKIAGRPLKTDLIELPALSNLDGAAVALVAGEEYDAIITKDPDLDFTATGFTVTKGLKAVAGTQIPPAPPGSGEVVIGYVARIADADGGGLGTIRNRQRHDDGRIRVQGAGGGVATDVGMAVETITGLVNAEDGEGIVSIPLVAQRNMILRTPGKVLSTATGLVAPSLSIMGSATGDGVDATEADSRKLGRAPNLYHTRREHMTWSGNAANADVGGIVPVFGYRRIVNAAGALPQTIAAAAGHRCYARVNGFVAYGPMRFAGVALGLGDWGGGASLSETATNEDHYVDKAGDWIVTRARFGGTGANSPDVTVSALGALNCTPETGIIQPFQNHGLMFHVAGVDIRFMPLSNVATLRFRLVKVPARGTVTDIIDTGPLGTFEGAGGTGTVVGSWMTRELREMTDGTPLEGAIEEPDHPAIIDPMVGGSGDQVWDGGEGVFGYFDTLVDIGAMEAVLYWYNLIIS